MRKLIIETTNRKETFDVIKDRIVVGRDDECDLVISGDRVSRKHCEIRLIGNLLLLEDLGSSNGTTVNGKSIEENEGRLLDITGEMKQSQERKDWITVADLLEYELGPLMTEWQKMIPAIEEQVLGSS